MDYRKILTPAAAFFLVIALVSCGYYSFSGSTLTGIETVYIPIFGNNTTEFGIEEKLTEAIIKAVNAERNLSVGERGTADALLEGRVTRVADAPLTYSASEQVSQYKVEIAVHIRFEDTEKRKVILEEDFSAYGEYDYPSGDREAALQKALDKIAQDIINKAVSGW